ncbi:hypothetical protein BO71DRAFT_485825 [Aspergillus ellipticus CBS 707.79]|uniref:Uncharacterized protein n=1 Tax=Aspergillus ellipticus CBS 707.79 TaxID=1448320 RepID=A0A319D3S5_9EURO|nr:hypothetical protein BO71DRAFT_485825 [Aspergillus ellipticus CBS 707.79]
MPPMIIDLAALFVSVRRKESTENGDLVQRYHYVRPCPLCRSAEQGQPDPFGFLVRFLFSAVAARKERVLPPDGHRSALRG